MVDRVEAIVVGAGVVGLACARALAVSGREVVVVDKAPRIGWETSSRNSEVVHSGLYYPTGSLKARACVEGKAQLYAYCDERHVPYSRLGKLIVSTSEAEDAELDQLLDKGFENGVDDLERIPASRVKGMEPELSTRGAIWSPSTGIVDSHALMLAFLGEVEDAGGALALSTPVTRVQALDTGLHVETGGEAPMRLETDILVNAGGLHAQDLAHSIEGLDPAHIPERHLARGVYFSLSGRSPFAHLIYPAPEPGGLGVHATLDLAGQCRFGPDVEWVDAIDYAVDPARGDIFYDRIRKYWPGLQDGALRPSYAGIRPKIVGPGEAAGDFVVQGQGVHGLPGLVNLFGIESPGLTSSLALASAVVSELDA